MLNDYHSSFCRPTSAGDTFVLSDGLLGLLGFSAFILILLVINWVCFILCTRKSVLLQRKADKARMKRQIAERQFSDHLGVLVNREVNRKMHKRQEESNNRNRQGTQQVYVMTKIKITSKIF